MYTISQKKKKSVLVYSTLSAWSPNALIIATFSVGAFLLDLVQTYIKQKMRINSPGDTQSSTFSQFVLDSAFLMCLCHVIFVFFYSILFVVHVLQIYIICIYIFHVDDEMNESRDFIPEY